MTFDQSEAPPARRPLPTFYYHTHFLEMLDFVEAHYEHVLAAGHRRFIDEFRALPPDAQRLYVRLVNRKGRLFAANRLRYPEIGDLAAPLAALCDGRWIGAPDAGHFDEVLAFMTRSQIAERLRQRLVGISRSLKKAQYVALAREHCDPGEFVALLGADLFVQLRTDAVQFLLFLYFGRIPDGLSQFTMRDLGLVRTHSFKDSYEARFAEREEAHEYFYFSQRLKQLETADTVRRRALSAEAWPEPVYAGAAALRDKLAYRLGRRAERSGDVAAALDLYGRGESSRCSERVVRLLLAEDDRERAKAFLERCLDDPRSDEEWLFANDVYARTFDRKRTSAVTDMLRSAQTIDIDEAHSGSPERAAVDYFERRGCRAFRVENTLWRTLFGLMFWDALFEDDGASLHSPFECLPQSLSDGTFYAGNGAKIESRLAMLGDTAALKRLLLKVSTRNYGTANGVFRWRRSSIDAVFALIDHAPGEALGHIVRRFCQDYAGARHGYPDLLVIEDRRARFVEIKAEGDQLRRNQLLRIEQLKAAGLDAEVVRIRWILDPNQVYVVVDVDTTGGRGDRHRVTEIGAVRMQNGRIVDRFQTLLNPQRSIPAGITRLTGITEAMVADAPYFADVADELEGFFKDAIFVAHNVGFDYRFLSREYERLGRPFRYPKLCTLSSMRRLYPGQDSYSLGALCRAYDIPLRQHHRALCDAEAAAELLLLINEKRAERLEAEV